jgi:hypothetical protein
MRVAAWVVQPVIYADDGEHLTEQQVQPQRIPAAQWQAFKDGGDGQALEQLRQQVEGAADPDAQACAEA